MHKMRMGRMVNVVNVEIGYAWFFKRAIAYGSPSDILTLKPNNRKNFGELLGVVKGLIPVDDSRVLYEYTKHSARFLERQRERRFRRRMGITRKEVRQLHKITEWC